MSNMSGSRKALLVLEQNQCRSFKKQKLTLLFAYSPRMIHFTLIKKDSFVLKKKKKDKNKTMKESRLVICTFIKKMKIAQMVSRLQK